MPHAFDEPTDDLGLSPEFLTDECIAREDAEYDLACGRPRCGGPDYQYGGNVGCPGCRHCSPPDHEAKPYGWGIETFEDPAREWANRQANDVARALCRAGLLTAKQAAWPAFRPCRDALWKMASRHSARRLRHSDIIWERLCDECQTHQEAKAAYEKWAKRAITITYRDEK